MNPEHLLSIRFALHQIVFKEVMTVSALELNQRKSAGSIFLNLNEKDYYYDPNSKKDLGHSF